MDLTEIKCEVCEHKEKAIAKKPLCIESKVAKDTSVWKCPGCGHKYVKYFEIYNYCPECGQKIDWSNDDEE